MNPIADIPLRSARPHPQTSGAALAATRICAPAQGAFAVDFRGIYEDGMIRPTGDVNIPDGAEIEFHVVPSPDPSRSPLTPEQLARLDRLARSPKSIQQLISEQGTQPIRSLEDLRVAGVQDDDVDDLLRSLREGDRK
jgi:predicted DNA-binding antitoxin AbrB/MazE fold protein